MLLLSYFVEKQFDQSDQHDQPLLHAGLEGHLRKSITASKRLLCEHALDKHLRVRI